MAKTIKKAKNQEETQLTLDNNIALKQHISLFLKGFLMGVCDIIPGISGGTIAFITGIYMRLITAIKNLTPKNIFELVISILKIDIDGINIHFKKLDLFFLITLFLGIFSAIFSVSKLIKFLFENYTSYTLAFFIGLILASSKIIFDQIDSHKIKDISAGLVGFLIGILMFFLVPSNIMNPSYFYVFVGGFVAVSALFLPGISGSFLLLIMGIYEFILGVLHNLKEDYLYIITFGFGAVAGAFFISRLITYLYKVDKPKTLYVLLGLVLGSLLIPIEKIINPINTLSYNLFDITFILSLFIIGVLVVFFIDTVSKKE